MPTRVKVRALLGYPSKILYMKKGEIESKNKI